MKNKNQHYVPQGYLRRFVDPTTLPGREPHLWVIERGVAQARRGVPRKEAAKSYYYTHIGADGERDDGADELLQALENAGLPVLRKLEDGALPGDLSAEERAKASHFVGALAVRTPGFRNSVERIANDIAKLHLKMTAAHPELFAAAVQGVREAGEEMPPDTEATRQFILSDALSIKVDPVFSLRQMLRLQPVGAQYAYNYSWRILDAPQGAEFVTSDRPFVMISTLRQPLAFGLGAGWESAFMEATLPLGPRAALLISQHYLSGRELVGTAVVDEVNRRTAAFASQVFATRSVDHQSLDLPQDWVWWQPLSASVDAKLLHLQDAPEA